MQGAFFGTNLPAARIEGLIASHVPKKHIVDVAAVYQRKWWDYRRVSPGHSFLLFAHHYYKSFKVAARTVLFHRKQTGRNGAGVGLIGVNSTQYVVEEIWDRDKAHITGMWNAMQACDALGLPYDWFSQLAFQVAIDRMWKRLPKPAQLYTPDLAAHVVNRWEALIEDRMILPRHPVYALDNYCGLAVQDQYHAWLMDRLTERRDPVHAIANVVYRSPQLPEAIAAAQFPAAVMTRARLLAA